MNKEDSFEAHRETLLGSGKTIEEAVRDVLQKRISISRENILPSSRVGIDLGADSLDISELAFDLDDEVGISIDEDFVINMHTTVADIVVAVGRAVEAWSGQIEVPCLAIAMAKT
jgi:acyl carrier protein